MTRGRWSPEAVDFETVLPGLSQVDYRIFMELQANGRTPFTTIADKLGVSEAYVRKRVHHLVEADFFSITAMADPRVIGLDYMAFIGVTVRNSATVRVAETLVAMPEINYVVICAGAFNVMAEVACKTQADLYRLVAGLRSIPGVQRTETFVYLKLLRQQWQWAQEGGDAGLQTGSAYVVAEGMELQPLDIEIIRHLERDGRAPFRRIGDDLGVSERTVSARVAHLIEHKVVQVIAVGNPLAMGFEAMAWLGVNLEEGAEPEVVADALAQVPGVCYLVAASGRFDIMVEIVCRSRNHLLDTLERYVGAIPEIAHVESFYYLRVLYRSLAGGWGAARSLAASRERAPSPVIPAQSTDVAGNGRRT